MFMYRYLMDCIFIFKYSPYWAGKEEEREQTVRWEIVSQNNFIFINKFILLCKQGPFLILMCK